MLTIYSKSGCPACVSAANLLTKYGVAFNTIKIDEDEAAKQLILSHGHRQVPQIYHEGYLFVADGWNGLMKMSEKDIKGKVALFENKMG